MKLLQTIKQQYLELLPPTIFFMIAFTLILITKQLILKQYGISWTGFSSAVVGAVLVGKLVLITDKIPFINRYTDRRLIFNASWKCLLYYLAALLVQSLDRILPLLMKHESLPQAVRNFMAETVWAHFWLIQIWLVVLFFVYCAMRELVRAIGKDKVMDMFFGSRNDPDSPRQTT